MGGLVPFPAKGGKMARASVSAPVWLAGASLALAATLLLPGLWDALALRWLFRIGTTAAFLLAGQLFWARSIRLSILTPVYLLGFIAFFFFSLIPALYVTFVFDPSLYPVDLMSRSHFVPTHEGFVIAYGDGLTVPFVGSSAERLVLVFSLLCLAAAVVVALAYPGQRGGALEWRASRSRPVMLCCIGLAACAAVWFLRAPIDAARAAGSPSGLAHELFGVMPVIVAFCLAGLAFSIRAGQRLPWFLLLMLVMGALFTVGPLMTKQFVIIVTVVGLFLGSRRDVPRRARWILGAAVVIAPLIALPLAMVARSHMSVTVQALGNPHVLIGQTSYYLLNKLVYRQGESGYCLKSALERHLDGDHGNAPFYFAAALVPRALWPAKPSFSRGHEYALAYCGYESLNPAAVHSASVTLLGEPLIQGGLPGLLVALLTIIGSLSILSGLLLRGPLPARVAVMALTPWLIDFDQAFSLYVALNVKVALVMAPLIVLVAWPDNRQTAHVPV